MSLTIKRIEKWVENKLEKYLTLYGLTNWDIGIEVYEDAEDSRAGHIEFMYEYSAANIYINADQNLSLEDVHETLCHELEHLLHSPHELLLDSIRPFVPEACKAAIHVLSQNCDELIRGNIGRLRANILKGPL